jgi:hypothetical protein
MQDPELNKILEQEAAPDPFPNKSAGPNPTFCGHITQGLTDVLSK